MPPWLWEHQLWGSASAWQLSVALGSELIPRKSKEFGAGKGDLWSARLPKENRVVGRELSLTTIESESVLGRALNTWEWSKTVAGLNNCGLAEWEDTRQAE